MPLWKVSKAGSSPPTTGNKRTAQNANFGALPLPISTSTSTKATPPAPTPFALTRPFRLVQSEIPRFALGPPYKKHRQPASALLGLAAQSWNSKVRENEKRHPGTRSQSAPGTCSTVSVSQAYLFTCDHCSLLLSYACTVVLVGAACSLF